MNLTKRRSSPWFWAVSPTFKSLSPIYNSVSVRVPALDMGISWGVSSYVTTMKMLSTRIVCKSWCSANAWANFIDVTELEIWPRQRSRTWVCANLWHEQSGGNEVVCAQITCTQRFAILWEGERRGIYRHPPNSVFIGDCRRAKASRFTHWTSFLRHEKRGDSTGINLHFQSIPKSSRLWQIRGEECKDSCGKSF